jgi:septum formation inhibitor MinC
VFNLPGQTKPDCDIVLLGWTSPGGDLVGRDVWNGSVPLSAARKKYSDLEAFAELEDVTNVSLSAIFDTQVNDEETSALGAPVLITAVRKEAPSVKTQESVETSRRAPVVALRGREAVEVCTRTIIWYSEYVSPLSFSFRSQRC